VGTVAEREKMPFEVTPFMPYLTRYSSDASKPAANASSTETKPPETASIPRATRSPRIRQNPEDNSLGIWARERESPGFFMCESG